MSDIKKVHFIGIGGAGMSATAKLLRDSGTAVTGSDEAVYAPVADFLKDEGIAYQTPYAAKNIPDDVDFIVIGKNAKLIAESNPEVAAAEVSGKPILSFPEVLGELAREKEVVVVAGSYGKSTVTALLAHCLQSAGRDPSFFIGAIPYTPDTNAHLGDGELFVLEGDEYPSSNTDARSKFLHLYPTHLILTPLAHDHFNVFPTPEDYLKPFSELVSMLPENGALITSAAGALHEQFFKSIERPFITYGVHEGTFRIENITWGQRTTFSLYEDDVHVLDGETSLLGEHNLENIAGVAAFLFSQNLVTKEQFTSAIASFRGIHRRLDKKSEYTTVPVYEGFGSSYEKARSAIEAMNLHFPKKRLVVIFEPHTFSWRNRDAISWYDTVFEGASKIFIYEPATQGAGTHKQLTQREIVARTAEAGFDVMPISEPKAAIELLKHEITENDAVLLLSSGPMDGLIDSVPKMLEEQFPV